MESQRPVFLTAEWRNLVMLNYVCDPAVLTKRVPKGTELDLFNGQCYVSVVAFLFLDTRVLGLPILGHRNFEEVNLRFYVRREVNGEIRRGVVFVKELVPRRMIAWVAKTFYNEPYEAVPMAHNLSHEQGQYRYSWRYAGQPCAIEARRAVPLDLPCPDSESAFITEHYWGYTKLPHGGTAEYQVEHPTWRTAPLTEPRFTADIARLYGAEFEACLGGAPASALIAEGSEVLVRRGTALTPREN